MPFSLTLPNSNRHKTGRGLARQRQAPAGGQSERIGIQPDQRPADEAVGMIYQLQRIVKSFSLPRSDSPRALWSATSASTVASRLR